MRYKKGYVLILLDIQSDRATQITLYFTLWQTCSFHHQLETSLGSIQPCCNYCLHEDYSIKYLQVFLPLFYILIIWVFSLSHLSASTLTSVPARIMTWQCFLTSAISVVIWFLAISSFTRSRHLSFGLHRCRFHIIWVHSTVLCSMFNWRSFKFLEAWRQWWKTRIGWHYPNIEVYSVHVCRMKMLPVVILAKYYSSTWSAVSERPNLNEWLVS